jgi:fumarate hydratase class II
MRTESDSIGTIKVPDEVYWGAQTARSLIHFNIGEDRMSPEIHNFLHAVRLLTDVSASFVRHCLIGLELNKARIDYFVSRSLMLITALSPIIGYDKCANLAHYPHEHDLSLREANRVLKFLSDEEFQKVVRPETMTKPGEA